MGRPRTLLTLALLAWPVAARAQDATTLGAVDAYATMASVGVTASYTGDADRDATARVELLLPEGNETYQHLDRVLAQFEDFCIVTQSVREGMEVQVTVKDAHGNVLMGDKSFEAGA